MNESLKNELVKNDRYTNFILTPQVCGYFHPLFLKVLAPTIYEHIRLPFNSNRLLYYMSYNQEYAIKWSKDLDF